MLGDGPLAFQEFMARERVPRAVLHDSVLAQLRGRKDAVVCGAHAVNAYLEQTRATDDVDIITTNADELARSIRTQLQRTHHIAAHLRIGSGYDIYHARKKCPRHLVDVWPVDELPAWRRIQGVRVLAPVELIAAKLLKMVQRSRSTRSLVDRADLYGLLLAFPDFKTDTGPVADCLHAAGASTAVLTAWKELVAQEILPEDEDAGY